MASEAACPVDTIRIVCGRCGLEEDWEQTALAEHLAGIGVDAIGAAGLGLRCRRFGCSSTDLHARIVPPSARTANLPRRVGRLDAHLLETALGILEAAVARSRGQAVATVEVRLALLVLHRYARDRDCVRGFWQRASADNRPVDDGLVEPLQLIRHRLVMAGWLAPACLLQPVRTWPWDSPAPPGWKKSGA